MNTAQLNLLPDSKLEDLKARQAKQKLLGRAYLITGVCLAIFILLALWVDVIQKSQLSDTEAKIKTATQQLNSTPNLNKLLTLQSQLKSLASLHQTKHITSRIFNYLGVVTPGGVSINRVSFSMTTNALEMDGITDSQATVNSFINNLKNAHYTVGSAPAKAAFSSVVETAFNLTPGNANYVINLQFDPALFAQSSDSDGKPITPTLKVKSGRSLDPAALLFSGQKENG